MWFTCVDIPALVAGLVAVGSLLILLLILLLIWNKRYESVKLFMIMLKILLIPFPDPWSRLLILCHSDVSSLNRIELNSTCFNKATEEAETCH